MRQAELEGRGPPTNSLVFAGRHFEENPSRKNTSVELSHRSGVARYSNPARELMKGRHINFF